MPAYKPRYQPAPARKGVLRRSVDVLHATLPRWRGHVPPAGQATVAHAQREWFFRRISRSMILLALLACSIAVAAWSGWRMLAGSDVFRLTAVTVQGNRMVRGTEILEAAGLEQGMNLLVLDTERAARRIRANPWIRSASVRRQWPSTVLVQVREYRPLAMIRSAGESGDRLYYVDRHGEIFAPVLPGQDMDYPVLTADRPVAAGDRLAEGTPVHEAFRLLLLAARGNPILPVQAISEIRVSPERGLVLYLVDRPFPIYLGQERLRKKYYRLVRILERLYRRDKVDTIREIDMDYMDNRVLVARMAS